MNREQELWAMALWVEKHHGANGPRYIAEKIGEMASAGEGEGVELWRGIAAKFDHLMTARTPN